MAITGSFTQVGQKTWKFEELQLLETGELEGHLANSLRIFLVEHLLCSRLENACSTESPLVFKKSFRWIINITTHTESQRTNHSRARNKSARTAREFLTHTAALPDKLSSGRNTQAIPRGFARSHGRLAGSH